MGIPLILLSFLLSCSQLVDSQSFGKPVFSDFSDISNRLSRFSSIPAQTGLKSYKAVRERFYRRPAWLTPTRHTPPVVPYTSQLGRILFNKYRRSKMLNLLRENIDASRAKVIPGRILSRLALLKKYNNALVNNPPLVNFRPSAFPLTAIFQHFVNKPIISPFIQRLLQLGKKSLFSNMFRGKPLVLVPKWPKTYFNRPFSLGYALPVPNQIRGPNQPVPNEVVPNHPPINQLVPNPLMTNQLPPNQLVQEQLIPNQLHVTNRLMPVQLPVPNQVVPNQITPNRFPVPNQPVPNQLVPKQLVPDDVVPNRLLPNQLQGPTLVYLPGPNQEPMPMSHQLPMPNQGYLQWSPINPNEDFPVREQSAEPPAGPSTVRPPTPLVYPPYSTSAYATLAPAYRDDATTSSYRTAGSGYGNLPLGLPTPSSVYETSDVAIETTTPVDITPSPECDTSPYVSKTTTPAGYIETTIPVIENTPAKENSLVVIENTPSVENVPGDQNAHIPTENTSPTDIASGTENIHGNTPSIPKGIDNNPVDGTTPVVIETAPVVENNPVIQPTPVNENTLSIDNNSAIDNALVNENIPLPIETASMENIHTIQNNPVIENVPVDGNTPNAVETTPAIENIPNISQPPVIENIPFAIDDTQRNVPFTPAIQTNLNIDTAVPGTETDSTNPVIQTLSKRLSQLMGRFLSLRG